MQTIFPSYFRKCESVDYEREDFTAPDGLPILLDWSRRGSRKLLIINHGLCGYTQRHYVLSTVRAFNAIGWDCLAWNYRGTGRTVTDRLQFTCNDSTDQMQWVTEHAIAEHGYEKVAFCGFSMGGNICLLYLEREADSLPKEIVGAVFVGATMDIHASAMKKKGFMVRIYEKHFVKMLDRIMIAKHEQFPDKLNIDGIENVTTMKQFDDRFTAPIMGFKDAFDYWEKTSACRWLDRLSVPVLIVNPLDDPFLHGLDYPFEEARRSKFLYLETPKHGGHCGFITPGKDNEWWPIKRMKEFIVPLADQELGMRN
ncbi:MAG: alpha/beta fold hydrolase [Victivallales bacterium]|nr:alpha/beta fold hydrolase [Victivallales bacterium]